MKSLYLVLCTLFLFCSESFGQSVTGIINDVRCDLKCNTIKGKGWTGRTGEKQIQINIGYYKCVATISWTYSLRSSEPRAKAPHFTYYILLAGDDGKRTLTKISYDPIENCWLGANRTGDLINSGRSEIVDDEKHSLDMPEMVVDNLKESLLRNVEVMLRSPSDDVYSRFIFTNRQKILLTRAEIWQNGKMIVCKNMYTPLHVIKADVPEDWWIMGKYPDKMSYSQ